MKAQKTKRRLLTAGAGVAAMTALEGIACGNPVAPPLRDLEPGVVQPRGLDAGADAPLDAAVDAAVDAAAQKP